MTATLAPTGLSPAFHPSGTIRGTTYQNAIPSGYATTLYEGAPVALSATGKIVAVTGTGQILGAFVGVDWVDAEGRPRTSNRWTGGTTIYSGTEVTVKVVSDPNANLPDPMRWHCHAVGYWCWRLDQ